MTQLAILLNPNLFPKLSATPILTRSTIINFFASSWCQRSFFSEIISSTQYKTAVVLATTRRWADIAINNDRFCPMKIFDVMLKHVCAFISLFCFIQHPFVLQLSHSLIVRYPLGVVSGSSCCSRVSCFVYKPVASVS